jgi:DNA-binding transcriptional LysR family regulator
VADEILRRSRVRPRVVFEIGNIDSILSSVVRTGTPTLLPTIVLGGREGLGLRAIPLAGKNIRPIDFGLLWPSASSASPAALALASSLKAVLARAGPRTAREPRPRR